MDSKLINGFTITEYEKFTDMFPDSIFQLTFKKLPLVVKL